MNSSIYRWLLPVAVATLMAAGCAKKELVKSDTVVPPVATATSGATPAAKAVPKGAEGSTTLPASTPTEKKGTTESAAGTALQDATLQNIFFDFDSATLSSAARDTLVRNAQVMKQNHSRIRIEGNCDERGSDEYNLALGEKRAKAALAYLVTLGLPADRLTVISYGKEKPVDPGHEETAWAKNRRDEFIVLTK
ncbi:MAG TPA: peptidoglycan-associated lipoprotein Pal [Geobacteraceae bacterium]